MGWKSQKRIEKFMEIIETIKNKGFEYATKSHLSLGIFDFDGVGIELKQKVKERQFDSDPEFFKNAKVKLKEEIYSDKNSKLSHPLKLLLKSSARGGIDELSQIVIAKGPIKKPEYGLREEKNKLKSGTVVASSLLDGLKPEEYFVSCYGTRGSLIDKKLGVGDAGYFTRKLVEVTHGEYITEKDCWVNKNSRDKCMALPVHVSSNPLVDPIKNAKTLYSLLVGRVLAKNIEINKKVYKTGLIINPDIAEDIAGYMTSQKPTSKIFIRSPLTCLAKNGLCKCCYGWDLSTQKPVSLDTRIGVIAAQSIGEPGTQLAMETFHKGGVVGTEETAENLNSVEKILEGKNKQVKEFKKKIKSKSSTFEEQMILLRNIINTLRDIFGKSRDINSKHFEVLIRQLLTPKGNYPKNIISLTQATQSTPGWLSRISFEQLRPTIREMVLSGKNDYLQGLKENIILGKLLPWIRKI